MDNIKLGYKKRPIKEMEIFYGADLVSGVKQTRTLVPEANKKFFSGEPMIAKHAGAAAGVGTSEWKKLTADDAKTTSPIAFSFTDSDRFDVQCAGKLLGIQGGTDTFVLGTAFYDNKRHYKEGDALYLGLGKVYTDGKSFAVLSAADGAFRTEVTEYGNVGMLTNDSTVDAGKKAIVGYVQGVIELQGNVAIAAGDANQNAVGPEGYIIANGNDLAIKGGPALWTEASGTAKMLQFSTAFVPGSAA